MKFESTVNLNTIDKVKAFCAVTTTFDGDVTLHSGKYIIDGKSIMGIFSLDLSKPIDIIVTTDNPSSFNTFMPELTKFLNENNN